MEKIIAYRIALSRRRKVKATQATTLLAIDCTRQAIASLPVRGKHANSKLMAQTLACTVRLAHQNQKEIKNSINQKEMIVIDSDSSDTVQCLWIIIQMKEDSSKGHDCKLRERKEV